MRYSADFTDADFTELVGKTITSLQGVWEDSDVVYLETGTVEGGSRYELSHTCCYAEDALFSITEVVGDVGDILNSTVTSVEVNYGDNLGFREYFDSVLITIKTEQGDLTMRWSDGYKSSDKKMRFVRY